ncbi:spore germination protein (amino acid permease) [Bacillus pakistanensis]|uniref:Spore germination protein (Amino acid permease) n=1 Tax=Rossellomorea pakistanensis TaxID=992288 RepID=A0ABS2NE77_9BACI|nr:GerAB/ArcD/ProY family transporter [Bacillus pakistanensis]MBM7586160.1 spore germination protein (amino acid permease) [Bacillus pakistanensis]
MLSIPENRKISPFLVFFLIHSVQVGVGVLGYQRVIAMSAGYDSWMSVILAGGLTHVGMFLIYKVVQNSEGDIISAHYIAFGKWIGNIFNVIFIFYFCLLTVTTVRTYIEVLQVWMYPKLSTWAFALCFLILVYYIVNGGIRTVTGVAFFGIILPSYLLLTFVFTFKYSDFRNLLPIFDHSLMDFLQSARDMSLTYLGYEVLLVIYPFINKGRKSQKWAHWALLTTTSLYTLLAIITFSFFSEKQLAKTVWATLSMWKIVEMPFIERFEYIGIANWCLIILPNACIALWCASRILKRMTPFRQRHSLIVLMILCVLGTSLLFDRQQINLINDISSKMGFYINYIYIPILLSILLIMKKVRKKQ